MQAIFLAAGMGRRLKELTSNATKCMVEVNGQTMIERSLHNLESLKCVDKIIFVIGYEGDKLREYVDSLGIDIPIEYIRNDIFYSEVNYEKNNNNFFSHITMWLSNHK